MMACVWLPAIVLATALAGSAEIAPEEGIVYGEAGGETLTMDYYTPQSGMAPHPAVVIIHGGGWVRGTSKNPAEAYCAQFLAPAGYAVFSINYRLAPKHPYPAAVADVQRAVRFLRHEYRRWNIDPRRIALLGGSAGGYLSNMAGLIEGKPAGQSADAVDRENAAVQAVISLYGPSDFRNQPVTENVRAFLGKLIEEKGEAGALAEASPVMYLRRGAPPFLLIHGDRDRAVPIAQSTHLQMALQDAGVSCDLMIIEHGGHGTGRWHTIPAIRNWEAELVLWLNSKLRHNGRMGVGIRQRAPSAPAPSGQ
jgi:alpha-L-fucosidase 2